MKVTPPRASARSAWLLVLASFLVQFFTIGVCFYAFSVYLVSIADTLDVDRAYVTLAMAAQIAVSTASGYFVGRLISRTSVRGLMAAGVVLVLIGCVGFVALGNLIALFVFYGVLVAAGTALLGPVPCNALLVDAFDEDRGKAIGIAQIGATAGGAAIAPIAAWLLISVGWQRGMLVLTAALCLVLIPLIWLLVPRRLGSTSRTIPAPSASATSLGPRDALQEPGFQKIVWIIGLNLAAIVPVTQLMFAHASQIVTNAASASFIVSAMAVCAVCAKPACGFIADHRGVRSGVYLCISLQILGLWSIAAAETYTLLAVAAGIFGFGYGGLGPLLALFLGQFYGKARFPAMLGLIGAATTPFNLIGLPFASWVFSVTGSYRPAFLAFLVLSAFSTWLFWSLRDRPAPGVEAT